MKVLDFGLVKSVEGEKSTEHSLATAAGLTPGTPAYMAPEMALGENFDGRADLYALGCVAYYLLTGHIVFEASNGLQMIAKHIRDAPVPPSRRSELPVPAALDRVVLSCLEKQPADRPRDAATLSRSLAAIDSRRRGARSRRCNGGKPIGPPDMSAQQILRRRMTTSAPISSGSGASLGSMPSDVVLQVCKRVGAVGLVAAGLWTFSLVANSVIARLTGHPAIIEQIWPYPGLRVAVIGLALSLLLVFLAKRLENRPQLLLNTSAGFLVLTCLLVAILAQWVPPPVTPRISWLCVLILSYPAIVPTTPGRTLAVSLLAASMEPVALWITAPARGPLSARDLLLRLGLRCRPTSAP